MAGSKVTMGAFAVAILTTVGVVVVALIQYGGWFHREDKPDSPKLAIAGRVVDEVTNRVIQRADITLNGKADGYATEDSGNFRIYVDPNSIDQHRVRLRAKSGARPVEPSFCRGTLTHTLCSYQLAESGLPEELSSAHQSQGDTVGFQTQCIVIRLSV